MMKNHVCALIIIVVSLLATPAAADTLLAQLTLGGALAPQGQFPPGLIRFVFGVSEAPVGKEAAMIRLWPDVDEGSVSEATPTELATMNAIIAGPHQFFTVTVATPGYSGSESIPLLVHSLGEGLAGYHLTRITQTIDQLDFYEQVTIPGVVNTGAGGQQTIRLYGMAIVPEPSTIVFVLTMHLFLWPRVIHPRRALPLLAGV